MKSLWTSGDENGMRSAQGYVWYTYPTQKTCGIGFHGDDRPPCAAEYLCDGDGWDRNDGYLVLTEEPEKPDTEENWETEQVDELDPGWFYRDDCWMVISVGWNSCTDGHYEMIFAGYTS